MNEFQRVKQEIIALQAAGCDDILVSIDSNGEAGWGEVCALARGEMEEAMRMCGAPEFTTDEMISGDRYLALFAPDDEE